MVSPDQTVYVWLGAKSTPHQRENAQKAGNEIEDNYISDNFRVVMVRYISVPYSFVLDKNLTPWFSKYNLK